MSLSSTSYSTAITQNRAFIFFIFFNMMPRLMASQWMNCYWIFNNAILRCMASVESVVWNEACCVISWNHIFDNKIRRTVWHATCPIPFYGLSWSLLSMLFAHVLVPLLLHLLSHYYYIQRFNSISHRMAVSVVDVLGAKWMRFIYGFT